MRRTAHSLLAALLLATAVPAPASAQQPPHAWLFGTWTGGLFPVPSSLSTQACLSQPVVIFTRDLVLRATLTEQVLTQREVESVRAQSGADEFRFRAVAPSVPAFGGAPRTAGFGCESPDVLHVVKRGENEISFPGCPDFPNPLVRCR